MHKKVWIPIAALLAAVLACNAPFEITSPTEPPLGIPPSPTVRPPDPGQPPILPTSTVETIFPEVTITPSGPMVQAGSQDVNCRYGPDTTYLAVGYLLRGYTTPILGISEDNGWWYIQDPRQPGIYCFVSRTVTDTSGDISSVPPIPTPPTRVINITVMVDLPETITPCVGGWPVTVGFDATIETNGPALVTYRWEISQGNVSGISEKEFTAFGAQRVEESQHIGAQGTYWVRLHVLSPNDLSAQTDYTVPCTP